MKKIFHFTVAIALLTLLPLSVNAQCKGFAKKICKVELSPYIHDGNYLINTEFIPEKDIEQSDTCYIGKRFKIYYTIHFLKYIPYS